jgi:hypothetical protein
MNLDPLYEAIKADPKVIHDPEFVAELEDLCEAIAYNSVVVRRRAPRGGRFIPAELADLPGVVPGKCYPIVPHGPDASEARLARILTAYVHGMLPRWSVRIEPKRTRGRPSDPSLSRLHIAAEAQELRRRLAPLELAAESAESWDAFVERVAPTVGRLIKDVGHRFLAPRRRGGPLWLFFPDWRDMTQAKLHRLLRGSVSRNQVKKAQLVLRILAYYHGKPVGVIRNIIGRTRSPRPESRPRSPV